MSGSFEKNLKTLEAQNPLLALQLRLIEPGDSREKKASIIPGEGTEVLFFYGVGPYYANLRDWLHEKSQRRLIFIEDELERFGSFLNQPETERLLLDPQVKLVAFVDPAQESLKEVIWTHLFRPYECFIMPGKNESFRSHFSDLQMNAEMIMCIYRDYGVPQMKNVFANMNRSAIFGHDLKGNFTGNPAIICGAGPSLEKNIDILKTLGNRALIFAGGSALRPLSKQGVSIHFGGSLDPDPPLDRYDDIEVPFFYQNQVSSELLSKVKGTSICMGASGCFPLENWLNEELPSFDAGTHVGTFLTHIATILGCSPIIFVGMDGCCSDDTLYFEGIEEERREDPLITEDRFGNPVKTRLDFLLGRRWLEYFAKTHPETLFLNATEGGLSMSGIENIPLQTVKEKWLRKKLEPYALPESQKRSNSKLELLSESVKKCRAFCDDLLSSLEKDMNPHTVVQDQELSRELFFQLVLIPLWDVWRYFLQKEEIVAQMQAPAFEKKVQQTLFYRDICERYERIL